VKRISAALVTALLAVVFGLGATAAHAQVPLAPPHTVAPVDTSWGGCGCQHL
jgi:hypothetical protein